MGVLLATDYAVKELPAYFPYIVANEDEAKRLINQVIHKSSEEITNFFLELFGMSDIVFDFIAKFNDLLQKEESSKKNINNDTKKLTTNVETKKDNDSSRVPQKQIQPKPKKNVVTRKQQKNSKTTQGTTTSEMLLKRIQKINQKEDVNKNKKIIKTETKKTKTKKEEQEVKTEQISGLPENLQKFENVPMTEESIEAMSKHFQKMQAQQHLNATKVTSNPKICGCQSLLHGLYTLSPNCLKCGKIICNLEAKQTGGEICVFCGSYLLSGEQIDDYLSLLKLDKMKIELDSKQKELEGLIKRKKKNYSENRKAENKKIHMDLQGGSLRGGYISKDILHNQVETIFAESKKQNLKVQDMLDQDKDILALKEEIQNLETIIDLESGKFQEDSSLKDAKKRLDTLLNFQNTSEERTKIIDVAGDFDFGVSGDVKALFEGTAEERALKLKLKQRNLKLLKEQELQRVGRGKSEFIFSIDNNGTVSVTQKDMDLKHNNKASTDLVIDEEDEELLKEINDLREKIYDLKLKDFDENSKKRFDPTDPKNKLSETTYISTDNNMNVKYDKANAEFVLKPGQRESIGIDLGSLEENIALFI